MPDDKQRLVPRLAIRQALCPADGETDSSTLRSGSSRATSEPTTTSLIQGLHFFQGRLPRESLLPKCHTITPSRTKDLHPSPIPHPTPVEVLPLSRNHVVGLLGAEGVGTTKGPYKVTQRCLVSDLRLLCSTHRSSPIDTPEGWTGVLVS